MLNPTKQTQAVFYHIECLLLSCWKPALDSFKYLKLQGLTISQNYKV